MEKSKALTAPYVPFKTFLTTLEHLNSHGVPNILDRSFFPSFSGATQSQIMSALLFLGLVNDAGIPSDDLHHLVTDVDNRQTLLRGLLESRYSNLFAADLRRVSPSQFDSLFSAEKYNVNGDTRKKARAFFFYALEYTGTPYSKLLTQRTRSPRKKKADSGSGNGALATPLQTNETNGNTGSQGILPEVGGSVDILSGKAIKSITLADSGKTVWLGTDANVLEIRKGRDRDFILALNDLFDEYEADISDGDADEEPNENRLP